MIFNEYGEIVTIENRYKSIDEWLNESYKIEEYLNEGALAAGVEKVIRMLIDGFGSLIDWIFHLSLIREIDVIKKHQNEIIEELTSYFDNGKLNFNVTLDRVSAGSISEDISRYRDMCQNPSMYNVKDVKDFEDPKGRGGIKGSNTDLAIICVNAVIDNRNYVGELRKVYSELKILSKKENLDKVYVRELGKLGRKLISDIKYHINKCALTCLNSLARLGYIEASDITGWKKLNDSEK